MQKCIINILLSVAQHWTKKYPPKKANAIKYLLILLVSCSQMFHKMLTGIQSFCKYWQQKARYITCELWGHFAVTPCSIIPWAMYFYLLEGRCLRRDELRFLTRLVWSMWPSYSLAVLIYSCSVLGLNYWLNCHWIIWWSKFTVSRRLTHRPCFSQRNKGVQSIDWWERSICAALQLYSSKVDEKQFTLFCVVHVWSPKTERHVTARIDISVFEYIVYHVSGCCVRWAESDRMRSSARGIQLLDSSPC